MSASPHSRTSLLHEELTRRVLVVDGAMGTALQDQQLTAEDFGGEELDGCNESLNLTRPDAVRTVHRRYLEAGADIVETNTFGGTPLVLAEYGLQDRAREINCVAAELAREVVEEFSTLERPRFVAGSMGPTTRSVTVTGGVTFEDLIDHFRVQALGLIEGGVDLLLVETQQDTRNVKAAVEGIRLAEEELGVNCPLMISGTIEATGTMLAGQPAEALVASLQHLDLLAIGLNCATGPEFMTDSIRSMSELARTRVSCVPNAGLPDEDGNYQESPAHMAEVLGRFLDKGWINLIGGCCGTTPAHIAAFAALAEGRTPRTVPMHHRALYSGIDWIEATEDNRPLLVGERTNVIGSRKFKRLIAAEEYEQASEIARAQAKAGAQILDICLADPDRDELVDTRLFMAEVIKRTKLPLMIDSTDAAVIECALSYSQGRAIINSINLEDGEERFAAVVPLARRFGAAVVVGTIDEDPEQGMALTAERKLAVARRSHQLLTQKYGLRDEDIVFDPLVFPCATGDETYVGSAAQTIEGVRAIKAAFPACKTVLGVSNVSFGLPVAGREVLNAVFLYHCTKAGLDLAIVNSERLERFARISDEEVELAEDLLFDRHPEAVARFAAHFRERKPEPTTAREELPIDERLARCIIEGTKDGLLEDLDRKLQEATPLEIVNGPLMSGMDEVGRLFNDNQLIVAEVLQSAEAMKAAVDHLEPHMEKSDAASNAKVLLATVKGDVHDIGKNLVEIILSNNGYEIVNLGIKVAPETLIEAVRRESPDAVGLSGLLVKSAHQMVVTAEDLRQAGVRIPLLVGGAALSARFTRSRIAPAYAAPTLYASDAMDGLALLNSIRRTSVEAVVAEQAAKHDALAPAASSRRVASRSTTRSAEVRLDLDIPVAPGTRVHSETFEDLDAIWELINPQMLYGKHMGYRGRVTSGRGDGDAKLEKLRDQIAAAKDECRQFLRPRAVWRWLEAESVGNRIEVFAGAQSLGAWTFPRASRDNGHCLADYILPSRGGSRDHVAIFVTTAGHGVVERAQAAKEAGEYLRSHALLSLALETAEALAEFVHRRIRHDWGLADDEPETPRELFQARYRGKRFSFGYPACPDLSQQRLLFELLDPSRIGVELTEGDMMDPEASVSALVFHHPDARYFDVGELPEVGIVNPTQSI
jgi:5-methyltetrahydrofolate--homocysteine methyltransferase